MESLIMNDLQCDGIMKGETAESLTLMFHNCGGQDNDKFLLCLALYHDDQVASNVSLFFLHPWT